MAYHIGTMLIDEHFNGDDECPLCKIHTVVNSRLTEQYLGEGVMENHTRHEVNALGFCAKHFDMLFAFQSKLGLALQMSTRLNIINEDIHNPTLTDKKNAKSAEHLIDGEKTCVVCKYLDDHMVRYYKTIAQLYNDKPSFKKRIKECKGFCVDHYAHLVKYSGYAHEDRKEYLNDLANVQKERMDKLQKLLLDFCDHHDYRNASKPLGEAKDALKFARKTIYGVK